MIVRRSRASSFVRVALSSGHLFILGGCVVRERPPLPPPAAEGILVPPGTREPPEDRGRVFVESTPHAKVFRTRALRPVLAAPELLCASTPCSLVLPYGDHMLTLTGHRPFEHGESSTVVVHVNDPFVAVRVNLTSDTYSRGVFAGLGLAGAGAITSFVGVLGAGTDRTSTAYDVVAVAGLVPLAVGLVLAAASTTTHQEGSATQWNPKATAQVTADGFAIRF